MKVIKPSAELTASLHENALRTIGFVPTMGALHEGHLSLVRRSCKENSITVVSIFVNPSQFNKPGDLLNYPRTLDADLRKLDEELGENDIVFVPVADDIYHKEKSLDVNLGNLDRIMEGKHRPGHFIGVIRIVYILFDLIKPQNAYFGQKDFQQLAVIKEMVKQCALSINIIACPIIREANGLAMSSRNSRLKADIRNKAGIINATLKKYSKPDSSETISTIKNKVILEINKTKDFKVEYFEIVDELELLPLTNLTEMVAGCKYFACIAVNTGEVRLIDNAGISFSIAKG